MRQFSATELANKTGDVLAAAAQEPVSIARHGKARFIMLSTEQFERLTSRRDPRHAFHVSELSDDEAEKLITDLEISLQND